MTFSEVREKLQYRGDMYRGIRKSLSDSVNFYFRNQLFNQLTEQCCSEIDDKVYERFE